LVAKIVHPEARLQVFAQGHGFEFTVESNFPMPGLPQGMVFRGEKDGYITFAGQGISHFVLPGQPDGQLMLEPVAGDLYDPRGLAIIDDTLFITHLEKFEGSDVGEGPSAFVGEASVAPRGGSVIAFDILPDGKLQNRRTIVPDLPAVNPWHAVNAIAAGPDGKLYVAIGGMRNSAFYADNPLLGTVIRFNPDGSGLEVYARGIRNIYDFVFDPKGRLLAADNDGPSLRGFKSEEVLDIRQGDNFAYPLEGTFDQPHKVRNAPPLWVMPDAASGSTGIEWAGKVGIAPGLLIGGPHLVYLPIEEDEQGLYVPTLSNVEPGQIILVRQGYMSIVQAGAGNRLYVGVYGFSLENNLYVLKFEETSGQH